MYKIFLFSGLSLLLFWGIFLRIISLDQSSLWMDEGYSFLAAATLLQTGNIFLETGYLYAPFSALFHFFEALSIFLFGENEWGIRLPSLLFGIFTAVGGFFVAKKLFPKNQLLPIFFFALLLFSTWNISWSVQGRMYTMLQFFFCGSLFFWWEYLQKSERKNLIFTLLFSIAAFFTHPFAFLLLSIFILTGFLFQKKWSLIFLILIFALPLFLFAKQWGIGLPEVFGFSLYTEFLWTHHSPLIFFILVSAFFIFSGKESQQKKLFVFLLLPILLTLVSIGFFLEDIQYRYLFPIYPLFLLLGILWAGEVSFWLDQNRRANNLLLPAIILFTLLFHSEASLLPQKIYALESDPQGKEYRLITPRPDFKTAFSQASEKGILMTSYPEIAHFYQKNTDFVVPFHWYRQEEWPLQNRPEYVNIPHFYSLEKFHNVASQKEGILITDTYAFEKYPEEVQGYIMTNLQKKEFISNIPEIDSEILIFEF